LESLLELLVVLLVVPPILCCSLQAAAMIIGMVIPWLALVVIALGVAACVGAGFAARRRVPPPVGHGDLPIRIPPVRRPPGVPDRRHEQRDH